MSDAGMLVVFGAGASHDFAESRGSSMPLTDQLFGSSYRRYLNQYPEVRNVVYRLDRAHADGSTAIEVELGKLQEASEDDPVLARQLFSVRGYISDLIRDAASAALKSLSGNYTNYIVIMNQLRAWQRASKERVTLATFNYDTLLDSACREQGLGWHIASINDYVSRDDYRLFKLHGSTDWQREIPDPRSDPSFPLVESAEKLDFSHESFVLMRGGVSLPQGMVHVPAIAIPVTTKYGFECPKAHLETLSLDLETVHTVLIAGWRASEPHFLALLKEKCADREIRLGICSGSEEDALAVEAQLNEHLTVSTVTHLGPGFTAALRGDLERFLSS